jgi:hypothetical protein
MSKRTEEEKVGGEKKESNNITEYVTEKWVVETTPDKLSELIKYATHDLDMDCLINDKNEIIFGAKGSLIGDKEILYLCTLPIEETADYIWSLPYTLIESIIEAALNNENDTIYEILAARITLLRYKYLCNGNTKKALRKLLRVCQVLGCIGDFDFGEWEAFRNEENTVANDEPPTITNIEPPKIIKVFIDEGQLEPNPVNGQYKPFKNVRDFVFWLVDNNYEDDISVNFILYYIFHEGVKENSIREYIAEAKRLKKGDTIKAQ